VRRGLHENAIQGQVRLPRIQVARKTEKELRGRHKVCWQDEGGGGGLRLRQQWLLWSGRRLEAKKSADQILLRSHHIVL